MPTSTVIPLIVRNYGVFWERNRVDFGTKGPGNRGQLLGFKRGTPTPADLRGQRGIYVLYEGTDINLQRVVYVGQTGAGHQRLLKRLRDHTNDHLWNRWQRFSWAGFLDIGPDFKVLNVSDESVGNILFETALDQLEATLIQLLEPLLNKQGPKWHGAKQYFQLQVDDD